MFSNKVYDRLKWSVQIFLPALIALYFAFGEIWGAPYVEEITGTLITFTVFLGTILSISNQEYINVRARAGDIIKSTTFMAEKLGDSNYWKLSPKVYDRLKWTVRILLPASGALYFALAKSWGFPLAQEVVATIAAVSAFIGIALGVNSARLAKRGNDLLAKL